MNESEQVETVVLGCKDSVLNYTIFKMLSGLLELGNQQR
jgi:hypothetical protein